jgi:hypothetical protein
MHDPMTVAFEIKFPWFKTMAWANGEKWRRHPTFITIWHVDPERDAYRRGLRGDDSCGWFTPPTTPEEREKIRKLGASQYSTLFGKRNATQEGKDYADVCYEPTTYDAVYWAWRSVKRESAWRRPVWMYGRERNYLSPDELDYIYSLASNPVDSLQSTVARVQSEEACGDFFLTIYRCYLRFNRPWWRHPRWHFWHWRFQVHPWQTFRRWAFSRCAHCGKRFPWGYAPVSHQWHKPRPKWFRSEVGSYHSECSEIVNRRDATLRAMRNVTRPETADGDQAAPVN